MIEPVWILFNRLICVIQPLEQMRGSGVSAARRLALRYGSVPPQLTLISATRAGHAIIAVVCSMRLLANVLATAFAGLFYKRTVLILRDAHFSPPFEPRFANINGSSGPAIDPEEKIEVEMSGTSRGFTGEDQFFLLESNATRNTSLPSWTDDKVTYLPLKALDLTPDRMYRSWTKYFAAKPRCKPMRFELDYQIRPWNLGRFRPARPLQYHSHRKELYPNHI